MNNRQARERGITAGRLSRGTGAAAILAGILYVVIQLVHPADDIASVRTSAWVAVACLTMAMSLLSLIGVTGVYVRQARASGWLGLIGFALFGLFWIASAAFSFMEAFVLPLLTVDAPEYVEGIVGIFGGEASKVDLGLLPVIAAIAGGLYAIGGLLFGIATVRAAVLPRPAAVLLAFGAVVTLAAAIIPHPIDRVLAVPMGAAFVWLGCALWAERGSSG